MDLFYFLFIKYIVCYILNIIVKLYEYLQIDRFTQEKEVKSFRLKAIIPRKPSTFRG